MRNDDGGGGNCWLLPNPDVVTVEFIVEDLEEVPAVRAEEEDDDGPPPRNGLEEEEEEWWYIWLE